MAPEFPCPVGGSFLKGPGMLIWYLECSAALEHLSRWMLKEVGRFQGEEAGVLNTQEILELPKSGIQRGKSMFWKAQERVSYEPWK